MKKKRGAAAPQMALVCAPPLSVKKQKNVDDQNDALDKAHTDEIGDDASICSSGLISFFGTKAL